MIKEIAIDGKRVTYNLTYKNVKNINLRISQDGNVSVSANRRVPEKTIESFILSKGNFVLNALERCDKKKEPQKHQYYSEEEVKRVILALCERVYPYYKNLGIKYPEIRFKYMVSQWGNCYSQRGILTFSLNLMYAPLECIEYIVVHEFTHFLQADHSKLFYDELEKVMPDWKVRREKLKGISIR